MHSREITVVARLASSAPVYRYRVAMRWCLTVAWGIIARCASGRIAVPCARPVVGWRS